MSARPTRALVLGGAALLVLMLTGCGMFGSKEVEREPLELVEFSPTLDVERVWQVSVGKGLSRSAQSLKPHFSNGRVWVADYRGQITAVNAETGARERSFETELDISAGPGVYGERLLVGTLSGQVAVLDADSGDIQWRAQLSSEILSTPILQDGIVVARCIDGRIFGLDARTGERQWIYDRSVPLLTLRGNSDPLSRGGQLFIGYDDGAVSAVRVSDGVRLWEQRVSVPEGRTELDRLADIDGPMAIVGADLYAVTQHGRMASLALDTGRIQWVGDIASHSGLSVSRTRLASTSVDDVVWMVDRQNGATTWQNEQMLRRGLTRPVFYGNYLVTVDRDGYMHWMDADTGAFVARERASKDRPASAPLVIGTTLYFLDADGTLSAWRAGAAI